MSDFNISLLDSNENRSLTWLLEVIAVLRICRKIFYLVLFLFLIFFIVLHQMALFTLQITPGDREIQTINSGKKDVARSLYSFFYFHLTFSFLLYATCLEAGGRSFSFRQAFGWDGWWCNIVFCGGELGTFVVLKVYRRIFRIAVSTDYWERVY